jgi:hypothetical protein
VLKADFPSFDKADCRGMYYFQTRFTVPVQHLQGHEIGGAVIDNDDFVICA